jgi:hypothetical protein
MDKESEQSYLFVVDYKGDRRKVFDGIGEVASRYLKNGMFLDIVDAKNSFGKSAIENQVPFYNGKADIKSIK